MLLLTILTTLLSTTSTWEIDFFSDAHCQDSSNYNSSSHWGTGTPDAGWCLQPGEPSPEGGEDGSCAWYTDGGSNVYDCTAATRPWPMSYRFRAGTDCCVGITDQGCDTVSCYAQEKAEKCLLTDDLPRVGDDGVGELKIVFQCYDHED